MGSIPRWKIPWRRKWQPILVSLPRKSHLRETLETWVRSLQWEDPLEEEMATHSSILTWKIPWTEEPRRLQSMWLQRVGHNWACMHMYTASNTKYYNFTNAINISYYKESEVSQLCPTLSDLMDCSLPVSSIHGIFQARIILGIQKL